MSDDILKKVENGNDESFVLALANKINALEKLEEQVKVAIQSADKAKDSANNIKNSGQIILQKTEAIKTLQKSTKDLADAQISAIEAQKISFEFQKSLGEITSYLFALGTSSIANNRAVLSEVEKIFRNKGDTKFSNVVSEKIKGLMKDLKDQEDIMLKQANLSAKIKEHDKLIGSAVEKNELQDEVISEQIEKDIIHDNLISKQAEKDEEHDRLLAEQIKKDEKHEKCLADQARKDKEHDRLLSTQIEKDKKYDCFLKNQAIQNAQYEKSLKILENENQNNLETSLQFHEIINNLSEELKNLQEVDKTQKLIIDQQSDNIKELIGKIETINEALKTKTNVRNSQLLATGVVIALILSIAQFFI